MPVSKRMLLKLSLVGAAVLASTNIFFSLRGVDENPKVDDLYPRSLRTVAKDYDLKSSIASNRNATLRPGAGEESKILIKPQTLQVSSQNITERAQHTVKNVLIKEKRDIVSTKQTTESTPHGEKGIDCGCPHVCDNRALSKRSDLVQCGGRIKYLMDRGMQEEEACEAASAEDPLSFLTHKPCGVECNPKLCKKLSEVPKLDISTLEIPDPPFKRYKGVVIATKVLWPKDIDELKQTFCTLNAAYNRHVNYDILVFTTIPWTEEQIADLQTVVAPAKLTVALEGPPTLEGYLEGMTKDERRFLYERCHVKDGKNITWFHHCKEPDKRREYNLGYCWQAEFRAYHIWNHEALKPYKYMFWIDADAFATAPFATDPMKVFIENDLNLMFDHFPAGTTRNPELKDKMMDAYGKSICKISLNEEDGSLKAEECKKGMKVKVSQVYGFHHITRLDIYRKESHQKFLKSLVSNYKFARQWDDQLAVTAVAVMEDETKARDHQTMGVFLGLHHNHAIDGKIKPKHLSYTTWWYNIGRKNWTVGREMCDGLVAVAG